MSVNWTPEQLRAIEERGSNILVAAAAGSGKTAVLVERIIRRICDAENPIPVDRLLVLTFTEAAASEMKRKISDAIQKRIKEEPDNMVLRDQGLLVHSAHISTIHAFCKSIIQNNIHETSLPADFTLIDDTENEVLRNQALDTVLERYYKRIEKKHGFRDLAVGYGGIKSDDNLRTTVLKLHNFVRSLAYPEKWLKETADEYKRVVRTGTINGTVWEKLLLEVCHELSVDSMNGLKAIWDIVQKDISPDHKYYSYYSELYTGFKTAFKPVLAMTASYDELVDCLNKFDMGRAPVKKGLDDSLVEVINGIKKDLVKAPLDEISALLSAADDEHIERIVKCSPRIQVLKQLVRQTERLHKSMKREKSALDFSDLEHEMIGLISTKKGEPTKIALKLRDRFKEILVDEYQDTNNIQDTMFRLLSRDNKNIFMVGDLKQSIYRFRNADPSIFAKKYKDYLKGDGGVCIQLFMNFRSRAEVVDTVNGLFSSIMKQNTGGLDYTKEEYLINGATYESGCGDFTSELLLTDTDKENYAEFGEYQEYSSNRLEAVTVAKRIRNLVDNKELLVKDKATETVRPVRLGDITILVRNKKKSAELEQVLSEYGISSVSETGQSYLDTVEVMTVLSFLQIIDNPRQDIPLLAVLRSAMFNFSPDELAEIRLMAKGDFYDALCLSAENGNQKAKDFLDILGGFRKNSVHTGVDEIILKICHELHYMSLVGALPGGKLRQANLNLLCERGAEFEQGSLSGLFHFMAYIESIRESGKDMVSAKPFTDESDIVSIMTIHKSKGLEYPVVILYGTEQYFNEQDASNSVIWHENAGLAIDYVDTENRVRYSSIPKLLVRDRIIREQRAEEMRLLYVALTRAKEKLIISATVGGRRNQWKKAVLNSDGTAVSAFVRRCLCMRDWMLSSFLSHPDALVLRELAERTDILPNENTDFDLKVQFVNHETSPMTVSIPEQAASAIEEYTDVALQGDITDRIEYKYPHTQLCMTPIKLSVSEIKRRLMPDSDYVPSIPSLNTTILTDDLEIGAAERGTITHYVLQHTDFNRTETLEQIREQLDGMVKNGLVSRRQMDVVSPDGILDFFKSPLGIRLKNADRVEREFDFYMEVPACTIDSTLPEPDGGELILLQGIADCVFFEGDKVILVDYKTDRVSSENAPKRARNYQLQIDYYTKGLESILNKPVSERYLYFLHCGETVKM